MPITSALSAAADFCAASLPNAAAIACRCCRSQLFTRTSSFDQAPLGQPQHAPGEAPDERFVVRGDEHA